MKLHGEVREIFDHLGEPRSVAIVWHQIGIVYQRAGRYVDAEDAYRKSLTIKVREGDTAREANTLSQLADVYRLMGRQEEAVTFHRQATDRDVELGNLAGEGSSLSNLAATLVELGRLDEARKALDRAIECKQSVGLTAEPWKIWDILRDLEHAAGQPAAALAAYQRAVESYLEYRRTGGENQNPGGGLCAAVAQAIEEGNTDEIEPFLGQYLDDESEDRARALIPKLQAIVAGERDPALPRDTALYYRDAVELRLLLDRLSGANGG